MWLNIYVTKTGPYRVEFLNSDYSYMTNPSIPTKEHLAPVGGLLHISIPNGTYTIPIIRLVNETDGVVSLAYAYEVSCEGSPTPVSPTPVAPSPTPVFIPTPTPVQACTDCRMVTIYPTGVGPFAIWTVNYRDCNNVAQSTSGNGLDSPRERYMCMNSIVIDGQARIEWQGGVPIPTPVSPTPTSPTPVFSGPIPILMDYSVNNNEVTLQFSGGQSGNVTIQLKKGDTVVGQSTASYSNSMMVQSSQYGYVDVYVGGYDIGSVYFPQQLAGAWTVQKSKSVGETSIMNLQFTKVGNNYIVQDLVENLGWPNVEYWHNSTLLGSSIPSGYSVEPLTDQHITKKRWGDFDWLGSDNDGRNRQMTQLTFKIV